MPSCLNRRRLASCAIVLVSVTILAGCSIAPIPTVTPTRLSLPIITITPTVAPTLTVVPIPTITPEPIPPSPTAAEKASTAPKATAAPRATATRTSIASQGTMTVKVFLVALNDNGRSGKKIGCDDSAVAVNRTIPTTSAPLTAALKELLSLRGQNYGESGLYNALYQSSLKLGGVSIANKQATINLTGTYALGGACDNPRFAAQIEETALQFPTVTQVSVFINNVSLDKILSGR